jgi:hypothetical protein
MEIIIVAGIVIAAAVYFILRKGKDIPESVVKTEQTSPEPVVAKEEVKPAEPVTPSEPAKPTFIPPVTTEVKAAIKEVAKALDANGDGKVTLADATAVVKKAATKAKSATTKAKKKK